MILLTVAIPFYNAKKSLGRTLDSITSALQCLEDEEQSLVEVLLFDNCSEDRDGESLALEWLASVDVSGLVERHDKNFGYDGNVYRLMDASQGEFIWLVGAGDCLINSCLKQLLRGLKKLPSSIGNVVLSGYLTEEHVFGQKQYAEVVASDHRSIIRSHNIGFHPVVTGNIVRVSAIKGGDNSWRVNSSWAHIEAVLSVRSEGFNFADNPTPLFVMIRERGGWYDSENSYEPSVRLMKILFEALAKCGSSVVPLRCFLRHGLAACVAGVFHARNNGLAPSDPKYHSFVADQLRYPFAKFLLFVNASDSKHKRLLLIVARLFDFGIWCSFSLQHLMARKI